jgi:PAS domain S-box-containing protein
MLRIAVEQRAAWQGERFRDLVENANDIIYATDVFGRFTFVNPAAARIMRCRERDLLGRSFLGRIAPSHAGAVAAFYGEQFLERRASTYFEFPARTAAGDIVWLGQNVRALFDECGTVVGFEAIAHDITARKTLEQQQQRLIAELQQALAGVKKDAVAVEHSHALCPGCALDHSSALRTAS